MKILITDTDTKITSVLKNGLNQHEIEVRDSLDNDYISNFNCVIIQSQSNKCDTPEDLNLKTQKTYNILSSCVESGIKKVVMISTLFLMQEYKESYTVTEKWKSTPSTELDILSSHLSEIIFKEFARTFSFQKILLRIGFPLSSSEAEATKKSSLSETELIDSVNKIIDTNFNERYEIIHIQNKSESQRFLTNKFEDLSKLSGKQEQGFYTPIERRS
ncbi:MAG: hypothetical protein CL906_02955 [Dehalococcoidia bacterium]|nr:hypothetical protein [Dehalococcoidia bacterium]